MARAATVGYTRPVGESLKSPIKPTKVNGSVGRFLGETPPPTKTDVLNAAQMARTRQNSPMARLERRVRDTQHDTDMYRIGGGALGPEKSGFESQARVKPRISWVKGPDGRIVPERKARTFEQSNVPWRPELPVGKLGDAPGISLRDSSGKTVRNPAYASWKEHALSYNRALSRQQALQPDNYVLQGIGAQAGGTPTSRYPVPINYVYRPEADRGGRGGNLRPNPIHSLKGSALVEQKL